MKQCRWLSEKLNHKNVPLPLLDIKDLSVDFVTEAGRTSALENISFTIRKYFFYN